MDIKRHISKGYENNSPAKNQILMWLVRVLVIFAGTFGALYSFVSGYELKYDVQIFVTISLIGGIVFGTVYGIKKGRAWVLTGLAVVLFIAVYLTSNLIYAFFVRVWNNCSTFLGLHHFDLPRIPNVSNISIKPFDEILVWTIIGLLFAAIIGFFAFCKTHFLPVFILTFVPMELAFFYGFVPDFFSVICFFICNSTVISMSVIKLRKKYFVNTATSNRGLSLISLIMCIFFAAALCISNLGLAVFGYERPKEFDVIRKNFATMKLDDLLSDKNKTVDLSEQGRRSLDLEEDWVILTSMEETSVYLKGNTGSVYEDNNWYDFDSKIYKEAPVSIMNNSNISIADLFATSDKGRRSVGFMTVRPDISLSGVTILPYGYYNNGSMQANNDKNSIRTEKITYPDEYTLSYDKRANNFWGEIQDNIYFRRGLQYRDLAKSYTDFVNEHYTDVPDNLTRLKETARQLKIEGLPERETIISSVIEVKNYLSENTEYSLEPGVVPKGQDFTEHFLFENKKGFCVHYATAGVMLLRAMGIPSRYASGYVITPDDFVLGKVVSNDDVTVSYLENQEIVTGTVEQITVSVSLTDENSHAWAEVYIDGLGWIPCEMTPGYNQAEYGLGDLGYDDIQSNSETTEPETTEPETEETTQEPTTAQTDPTQTVPDDEIISNEPPGIGLNVLLIIFGVIAAVIVIDLLARLIIVRRRYRSFKGQNRNKNAKNLYLYLEKILSYADFKCLEKENLTNGFEKLFRRFDFTDEEKCVETVLVYQKLFYGNATISEEELVVVQKFVLGFVKNFISVQKPVKRFIYKYILFLA